MSKSLASDATHRCGVSGARVERPKRVAPTNCAIPTTERFGQSCTHSVPTHMGEASVCDGAVFHAKRVSSGRWHWQVWRELRRLRRQC